MIDFFNFYVTPGLVVGSIYALGAAGISLLFGILRFAHFAHGDMMTLGAYLALTGIGLFGLSPYAALLFAIPSAIIVAWVIDRIFYRPLRKLNSIVTVISSFGIMLMLRSGIQLIWGVDVLSYEKGIATPILLGEFRINPKHGIILFVTLILALLLHLFLNKTRMGKAMRAISDDPDLARITGIDAEAVTCWTWALGAALATIAGVFIGINTKIHPNMGWDLLLPLFAAAILGGIGRPLGAIAGGFALGLAQEIATYPFFGDEPLIAPSYKSALAFTIMIAMLIWRPAGLLKGRVF